MCRTDVQPSVLIENKCIFKMIAHVLQQKLLRSMGYLKKECQTVGYIQMTANKTTISKDSNENWHQTDTLTFQMHTGYFFFLNRVQYSFSEMIHHETWLVGYFLSLKRKSKYSLASDMFLCILHTMYVPRLLNLLLMYSMLWILWFRANTIFLVLK